MMEVKMTQMIHLKTEMKMTQKKECVSKIAKRSKQKGGLILEMQRCMNDSCIQCASYQDHSRRYHETRKEYEADAKKSKDSQEETYLSVDMQKVILLPRLPTYKRCLFTKRIVTVNKSFVPIGKNGGNGIGVLKVGKVNITSKAQSHTSLKLIYR